MAGLTFSQNLMPVVRQRLRLGARGRYRRDRTGEGASGRHYSEESQRMKRQVDELLELARMQAGQLRMEHETVNINELWEHCREVFGVQAADKHVEIKLYAELLNPCTGDFDRLEQAFSKSWITPSRTAHPAVK